MKTTYLSVPLLLAWLCLIAPAPVAAAPPGVTARQPSLLLANDPQKKKAEPWWKQMLSALDEYASSKTGMIQIGVLAVLLSLYVITRKDGPK
jgi:hypothetical protein